MSPKLKVEGAYKPLNEYDPLVDTEIARACVRELQSKYLDQVGRIQRFEGAGVYALYYGGQHELYAPLNMSLFEEPRYQLPIYVGRALPVGSRKGLVDESASPLFNRLQEHLTSITFAEDLDEDKFLARYLVLKPMWIEAVERFLIEHYQPVWNCALEGFGSKAPGSIRKNTAKSQWDTLHPGRPWATEQQPARSRESIARNVRAHIAEHRL